MVVRVKLFVGALLACVLAACPIVVSVRAAASAQKNSCCPAPADSQQNFDCCLRAVVPSNVTLTQPQFFLIGLVNALPALVVVSERTRLDFRSLSSPDHPSLTSRSSRAPPSGLA
jgi:hypothetical protein